MAENNWRQVGCPSPYSPPQKPRLVTYSSPKDSLHHVRATICPSPMEKLSTADKMSPTMLRLVDRMKFLSVVTPKKLIISPNKTSPNEDSNSSIDTSNYSEYLSNALPKLSSPRQKSGKGQEIDDETLRQTLEREHSRRLTSRDKDCNHNENKNNSSSTLESFPCVGNKPKSLVTSTSDVQSSASNEKQSVIPSDVVDTDTDTDTDDRSKLKSSPQCVQLLAKDDQDDRSILDRSLYEVSEVLFVLTMSNRARYQEEKSKGRRPISYVCDKNRDVGQDILLNAINERVGDLVSCKQKAIIGQSYLRHLLADPLGESIVPMDKDIQDETNEPEIAIKDGTKVNLPTSSSDDDVTEFEVMDNSMKIGIKENEQGDMFCVENLRQRLLELSSASCNGDESTVVCVDDCDIMERCNETSTISDTESPGGCEKSASNSAFDRRTFTWVAGDATIEETETSESNKSQRIRHTTIDLTTTPERQNDETLTRTAELRKISSESASSDKIDIFNDTDHDKKQQCRSYRSGEILKGKSVDSIDGEGDRYMDPLRLSESSGSPSSSILQEKPDRLQASNDRSNEIEIEDVEASIELRDQATKKSAISAGIECETREIEEHIDDGGSEEIKKIETIPFIPSEVPVGRLVSIDSNSGDLWSSPCATGIDDKNFIDNNVKVNFDAKVEYESNTTDFSTENVASTQDIDDDVFMNVEEETDLDLSYRTALDSSSSTKSPREKPPPSPRKNFIANRSYHEQVIASVITGRESVESPSSLTKCISQTQVKSVGKRRAANKKIASSDEKNSVERTPGNLLI